MPIEPADERRHPAGDDPWWQEGWELDATWPVPGGGLAGAVVRWVVRPATRRLWYVAGLVRPGHPTVSVVDLDVAVPVRTPFELRAPGLWAELICEEPLEHWSVNNEAHGLALEDPDEAFGRGYGEVVPIAFELGWEATGPPVPRPSGDDLVGYAVAGIVHGVVHLDAEQLEVAGRGTWRHWWGVKGWGHVPWGPAPTSGDDRARVGVPLALDPSTTVRWELVLGSDGWQERART